MKIDLSSKGWGPMLAVIGMIIVGIAMAILCASVDAKPRPTPTPTPIVETTPSREALFATVEHISQLAKDALKNLDAEKASHLATDKTLVKATDQIVDLQKKVDAITLKLNTTQDKLDATSKTLWWYRLHWYGSWIIFIIGVLVCLIFAWLKWAGPIAAKL